MSPLRALPVLLREVVAHVPAARRAGDLALVEHVWHLADLEAVFHERIERLVREDGPRLPDVDGVQLAQTRGYLARDIAQGLALFERARAATIARFARAAHHARRTGVLEGVGPIELGELPARIALHDRAHARELAPIAPARLAERLLAFSGAVRSPCGPRASYPPRRRWLARTRELVAAGIRGGEAPSLADTAARIGMSARSLQRRLRAEGLGFRCLLEEARQQLAVVRLARGDDLAQVRAALGYADRRTAARAVRRWLVTTAR